MIDAELRVLEQRIRVCPDDVSVRFCYAHALGRVGRLEDAREEYGRLLRGMSPADELFGKVRDGFVGVLCDTVTPVFGGYLTRHDALREALRREVCLQSLADAVAVRCGSLENSQEYQVVSTLALYYHDREKGLMVAFAEVPTTLKGIAFVREGYEMHGGIAGVEEFVVPAHHDFVAGLLSVAECEDRVVSVPSGNLLLSTRVQERGISEYSQHPFVQALFGGGAFAEMNAEFLRERNHMQGRVWYVSRGDLYERLVTDNVLVRPVGLGGDVVINVVGAYSYFGSDGRARGVSPRRKIFSTGNEG